MLIERPPPRALLPMGEDAPFRPLLLRQLEPWASRRRQGRVDRRCGQPTLCRDLAQARRLSVTISMTRM
jgi:hypothetical protein